ncbi:MAG: response regulator [Proteobacteria bacterium]|nr:response regulator [Pseudomonadota bacterium]
MKLESDSEINYDLKAVLTASERAKNLVKQILAFSRQTKEEKMPIQMGLIAKEALKLLRSSLPTTIGIRQNIQSRSLIMSDPTQLHQIIMNLCTNAAHAMREEGGTLEITLTDVELDSDFASTHLEIQPGTYLNLTVSDTGHGIPPEVMNRIFDPFFTTKPKDEGTGLGLSVVHGIVKDCGGTIMAYSEPDKGTTFQLYFPIIKYKAAEKLGDYEITPTGTERILMVDDEKTIIDINKRILKSLGYTVEARTSSLEALECFKAMPDKFDLVISDVTMPLMTGDLLAQEMMKIRPDLPVILCTGFSKKITREKAETIGIKAFLMKPLLKKEMAHIIRMVLDEAKRPVQ